MTPPAPEPRPKRSRRMVVWLVAAPVVILLLALAGANWKTFHLAYAKHLMSSDDPYDRANGVEMVYKTHLRKGMSLKEVRQLLTPAKVIEGGMLHFGEPPPLRYFKVCEEVPWWELLLGFDQNDKLHSIRFTGPIPPDWK